jgi:hypothetical protein
MSHTNLNESPFDSRYGGPPGFRMPVNGTASYGQYLPLTARADRTASYQVISASELESSALLAWVRPFGSHCSIPRPASMLAMVVPRY